MQRTTSVNVAALSFLAAAAASACRSTSHDAPAATAPSATAAVATPTPQPPAPSTPAPGAAACATDDDCVVTSFAGCCACCPCAELHATSKAELARVRARCAAVECGPCRTKEPCPACRDAADEGMHARCTAGACTLVETKR